MRALLAAGRAGVSATPRGSAMARARNSASFAFNARKPRCGGLKLSSATPASAASAILRRISRRRRRVIAVIDFRHHPGRRDLAGRQVAGIGQRGIGECDVGVGQRLGAGGGAESRDAVVGRIKPVGCGIFQLRDHRFRPRIELAVGGPQRGVIARGIEGGHRFAVGRAVDAFVELPGCDDGAQLVGDLRLDRCRMLLDRAPDAAGGGAAGAADGGALRSRDDQPPWRRRSAT